LVLGFSFVAAQYDYDEVLHKSFLFYEAQRSGKLPANNRIPWRADSALGDKGENGEDLTGGWYDAGDHVKFNFPAGMTTTTLIWGAIEFQQAYQAAGEWQNVLGQLRWILDYFIKCHVSTNKFYGQVGEGQMDHNFWGRPEDMTMARPAWYIDTTRPGSDLAGEVAAAFAAGYLLFRDTDAAYGFTLLDNARRLYEFAYRNRGFYSISIPDANNYYGSNDYTDELAWGAAWLYRATGEALYLARAREFASTTEWAWTFDWGSKLVGAQLVLSISGDPAYTAPVQSFLRNWFPGGYIQYTPKGLAWVSEWGSNRFAANAAFIATVAAKYNILRTDSLAFARQQIHYILGSTGRSFVIGYGVNPPQKPHHRASSCQLIPAPCGNADFDNPGPNPQVLYGGMVGGPDINDVYVDDRGDYVGNEVACDYNSGFQGAVAGLKFAGMQNW
jgi:hypothetical protein